jgi:hypothetical protein
MLNQANLSRLRQGCLLACQAETVAMGLPINLGKDVASYILFVEKFNSNSINRVAITLADKYSESFASATDSGKLSIVRVSLPVQLLGAQTYEDFVTNFDDLVNKDEEASNVIKK